MSEHDTKAAAGKKKRNTFKRAESSSQLSSENGTTPWILGKANIRIILQLL